MNILGSSSRRPALPGSTEKILPRQAAAKRSIAEFGKMLAAILEPPATLRRRRPRSHAAKAHLRAGRSRPEPEPHAREKSAGTSNPFTPKSTAPMARHARTGAGGWRQSAEFQRCSEALGEFNQAIIPAPSMPALCRRLPECASNPPAARGRILRNEDNRGARYLGSAFVFSLTLTEIHFVISTGGLTLFLLRAAGASRPGVEGISLRVSSSYSKRPSKHGRALLAGDPRLSGKRQMGREVGGPPYCGFAIHNRLFPNSGQPPCAETISFGPQIGVALCEIESPSVDAPQ